MFNVDLYLDILIICMKIVIVKNFKNTKFSRLGNILNNFNQNIK